MKPMKFNGVQISVASDGTRPVTQQDEIQELDKPKTYDVYKSREALAQYIKVCFTLVICAPFQFIALVNTVTSIAQFASLKTSSDNSMVQMRLPRLY